MKYIPLTQGKVAIVDDEDFEKVSLFKWWAQKGNQTFYAIKRKSKRNSYQVMARFILEYEGKLFVDHKNKNGLDNRKNNLRLATVSQNGANRHKTNKNKSGYKGVYKTVTSDKWGDHYYWRANIKKNGKAIVISCKTKEEAAAKYNKLAIELFGEFACLNKIAKERITNT